MMKKIFFQTALLPVVLATAFIFAACGNEPAANHEAALPHNKMSEAQELSDAEILELMAAEGKSARLVSLPDLEKFVKQDTATLVVVNFWKTDCQPCLDLQAYLQNIQLSDGAGKMKIYSVNLDPPATSDQVNLALRKAGITSGTFQLSDYQQLSQSELTPDWNGSLPALSFYSEEFLRAFYQQEFSENELRAVLQPFLL